MTHRVCILPMPGFQLLDMAGPLSVFHVAAELVPGAYETVLASADGAAVRCSAGVLVQTRAWRGLRADTVLVPGGWGARVPRASAGMLAYLRAAHARGRRVASVCTGAFVLAQAGILQGRRVTTHWRHAAELQQRHPELAVEADRIYVQDGRVWTSAGITAGIDLALALVQADHGEAVARATAREMVVYHRRTGGQSQFSALQDPAPASGRMREVLAHVGEHLDEVLDIERLAGVACLSPRQFCRQFKRETGQTPAKAVERVRAEAARELVEEGEAGLDAIARRVGFGDTERMRRAFIRIYGQPPQALRRSAGRALQ